MFCHFLGTGWSYSKKFFPFLSNRTRNSNWNLRNKLYELNDNYELERQAPFINKS